MSTGNYGGWGYPDGGVKYYQCCRCQKSHFEDEPIYQQHIGFQSKHGIFAMSTADFQRMRLSEVERATAAAEAAEVSADEPSEADPGGPVVILILEAANGQPTPAAGQFVKLFHAKAAGGRGYLETTQARARAKVYPSKLAAFREWKNSSLKAFTVELQPAGPPPAGDGALPT